MFSEIDFKIKILAKIILIVGILASFIGFVSILINDSDLIVAAVLTLIGGLISTFILSILIYAFGELLENVCQIEKYLRNNFELQKKIKDNEEKQSSTDMKTNTKENDINEENENLKNMEAKGNNFLDDFLN